MNPPSTQGNEQTALDQKAFNDWAADVDAQFNPNYLLGAEHGWKAGLRHVRSLPSGVSSPVAAEKDESWTVEESRPKWGGGPPRYHLMINKQLGAASFVEYEMTELAEAHNASVSRLQEQIKTLGTALEASERIVSLQRGDKNALIARAEAAEARVRELEAK